MSGKARPAATLALGVWLALALVVSPAPGWSNGVRATPASRTRAVTRQAHKAYWRLVNAYDANGYNKRVHRITKRQLARAANAVADLIQS